LAALFFLKIQKEHIHGKLMLDEYFHKRKALLQHQTLKRDWEIEEIQRRPQIVEGGLSDSQWNISGSKSLVGMRKKTENLTEMTGGRSWLWQLVCLTAVKI
jgi:hypothetical protein